MAKASKKDHVSIYLDPVHLELLDDLVPFYGSNRAEVVRFIVVDWLSRLLGLDRIRTKGGIK